jgi:hypothetical protein
MVDIAMSAVLCTVLPAVPVAPESAARGYKIT